jgi:hypothetical protein
VATGTFRGGGDVLLSDEAATSVRTVFQGDTDAPVLALTLDAPPSNEASAFVEAVGVRFEGASARDFPAVRLYRDSGKPGSLDAQDLAEPPLAEGTLSADGFALLRPAGPLQLSPGDRLRAIVAVDVDWKAAVDAVFNASVATVRGVYSAGVVDVLYTYPSDPWTKRIFEWMPADSRAAANLVLNELIFPSDEVEIKDTSSDTGVDLTSPQISIRFYGVDDDGIFGEQRKPFSGSTNSEGFAVLTMDWGLNFSDDAVSYTMLLRCHTCGAGGTNKTLDSVSVPQGTSLGAYGRYPDGTGGWRDTEENTSNDNNFIPEFSDAAVPALGVMMLAAARGWRRRTKSDAGGGDPSP